MDCVHAHGQTLDGKTHTINVESYKTVLEAALDEGIEMPHDCKLGTCLVGRANPCKCIMPGLRSFDSIPFDTHTHTAHDR